MRQKTIIFTIVILISAFVEKSLSLDPRLDFKQMSSEHFDIIYDAKSYNLAKTYLEEAERSHRLLSNVFGISPSRTTIVLDNTMDLANGAATGVPRPTVYVYASMPTVLTSIDYFSNWPRDVFLHEYAHILNMEPATGFMSALRFVFGSIIRPNMFLPRWYLEGLAVELESRYNLTGRLKSPDYDALIRSFFIEKNWGDENISSINETTTPYWPEGQRPYFYGALLWHEILEQKKLDTEFMARFNNRNAGRVPYFISEPIYQETNLYYQELLHEVHKKYHASSRKQIAQIQTKETPRTLTLAFEDSIFDHSPTLSPDGKSFAFISKNLNGDTRFVVRPVSDQTPPSENKNQIKLINTKSIDPSRKDYDISEVNKISWFPDNKRLVFDGIAEWNRTYFVYDLYVWDLENGNIRKLTRGLRAKEPSVSPDGSQIAYVKNVNGETHLYSVNAQGKNETLVYKPEAGRRISRPEFINNTQIAFAMKDATGADHLHLYDLDQKRITSSITSLKNSRNPVRSKHGITFTSTQSGVENLYYASNNLKEIRPLTNSKTKILNGFIADSKVFASELTAKGPKLKVMQPISSNTLPQVAHSIASNFPKDIDDNVPELNLKEESYWPTKYMFPTFWMPVLSFPADGVIAGATTVASDPTGFHSYSLTGFYDSRPKEWSGFLQYNYINSLGTTVFAAYDTNNYYDSLDISTDQQGAKLVHGFFIPSFSNNWKSRLGYEYIKRTSLVLVNSLVSGREHYFTGPSIGITYSDMKQGKMEISPHGFSASANYTYYLDNSTNTDHDKTELTFNYYHKKWLPTYHVAAFTVKGSYTEANRNIFLGTTSTEAEYTFGPLLDGFVIRGYPMGQFIGYSIYSGTFEYRFPIMEDYSGSNSLFPYFLKRIHGDVFVDTVTLKGAYFDKDLLALRAAEFGKYYTSAGLEIKLDSTLFYHVPATIKITAAYGFNKEAEGGGSFYFSISTPEIF